MLQLQLKPSRWDLAITVLCHSGALVALALMRLPGPLELSCAALVFCSGYRAISTWYPPGAAHPISLEIGAEQTVLRYANRSEIMQLPVPAHVSEWLIILWLPPVPERVPAVDRRGWLKDWLHSFLNWFSYKELPKHRLSGQTLYLFPDSLTADADRRSRGYLRFGLPRQR